MSIMRVLLHLSLAACLTGWSPAFGQSSEVLAEFPPGSFLENGIVLPGSTLIVTNYFAKSLERVEPGRPTRQLAELPAHPVGLLRVGERLVASAHGTPFTSGPGFTQTQKVLLLDAAGAVQDVIEAPEARFLNGLTQLGDRSVLIADSIASTIWRLDIAGRKLLPWLSDPLLALDPQAREFRPGANGLKIAGDRLFVSNSALGLIAVVRIGSGGTPDGPLAVLARTGPVDDFHIESSGDIVFTTHGAALKRLRANGDIEILLDRGCDACTSVVPLRNAAGHDGFAVMTTGNLLEGGKEPARVLFVRRPAE
jgi:hypothetical protein